jgi:phage gpG-like protein
MPTLTVEALDKGAKKKLDALLASGNIESAYDAIGSTIANRVRLCFKLGTDPYGSPWKKIKFRAPRQKNDKSGPSTTGRRQRYANRAFAASKGEPLRDTGRLARSITYKVDGSGVTIGTNVFYAPTHQFGATIVPKKAKRLVFPGPGGALIFAKKVTIPQRAFLPIRTPNAVPSLPPSWSVAVVRAIKARLISSAVKV